MMPDIRRFLRWFVLAGATLFVAGCARTGSPGDTQATFATPDEAVGALVSALEKHDQAELGRLLGPDTGPLLSSGDAVTDSTEREGFLARYRAKHVLVAGGPDDLVLQVGEDDWPMPIPIVRRAGRWRFDGAAGADEIVMRRIGANELRTIDVMHGFVAAEEDYAAESRDGQPAGAYAQRIRSAPGKHDGLYWEAAEGEPESPAGPMLAAAASEGYTGGRGPDAPYHGYRFRLLTSQGANAAGGARDYLADGRLDRGFALIAWPATYGASGIMSFLINQDGVVYQRDLGAGTDQAAAAIKTFDPDTSWTPIAAEQ